MLSTTPCDRKLQPGEGQALLPRNNAQDKRKRPQAVPGEVWVGCYRIAAREGFVSDALCQTVSVLGNMVGLSNAQQRFCFGHISQTSFSR